MKFLRSQEHDAQWDRRTATLLNIPSAEAMHPGRQQGAGIGRHPSIRNGYAAEGLEPPTNGLQMWSGTNIPKSAIRSTLFLLIFP